MGFVTTIFLIVLFPFCFCQTQSSSWVCSKNTTGTISITFAKVDIDTTHRNVSFSGKSCRENSQNYIRLPCRHLFQGLFCSTIPKHCSIMENYHIMENGVYLFWLELVQGGKIPNVPFLSMLLFSIKLMLFLTSL